MLPTARRRSPSGIAIAFATSRPHGDVVYLEADMFQITGEVSVPIINIASFAFGNNEQH